MLITYAETGEDVRLLKANEYLWRVADLVSAGNVILGFALSHLENDPPIKGLDGILRSIGILADLANGEIIEAKDNPMELVNGAEKTNCKEGSHDER